MGERPPPVSETTCRSCGGAILLPVLSLGSMPLANALLTKAQLADPEPTFPLNLVFCTACTLLQITETIPPERLFCDYSYFSSYSDTIVGHVAALASRLVAARSLDQDSLVVEIASNDGYLLQHYRNAGVPILGIEPARNVAEEALGRAIPTLCEFFDESLGKRLADQGRRADVVHAHNVLAHVADLNGFVAGLGHLLKPEGIAVLEVPYARDMIDRCEFDTIYHEHLCYFSLSSLVPLLARHGLKAEDVGRVPVHGGSLRLFVTHAGKVTVAPAVGALLAEERASGIDGVPFYEGFASRVEELKSSLRMLLSDLRRNGKRIAGYGAAAKGTVLLNSLQLEPGTVAFVVDRSSHKQGRFVPGVRLPIYGPEKLLEEMPEYVLLLAWNISEEVIEQQAEYRRRGGRFIVPLPRLAMV